MDSRPQTARALADALARALIERHDRLVRSWGPGRYLVGDGDEAMVLLAPEAHTPEALAALVDEVGWRTAGAPVRLVLVLDGADPAALAALREATARHPQLQLVTLEARSGAITSGALPEDHVLRTALAQPLVRREPGENTARMRLVDALARAGRPWATIALIAMNVVVFVLLVTGAQWDSIPALVGFGANAPELVQRGEWWRLATAMFVHVGPVHLGFNLWALWVLGSFFERLVGAAPLTVIYLLSGLFASLVSAWAHHAVSAGASGAIFGVFGLFAAVAWRPRGLVHPLLARALLRNVLLLLGLNVLIGLTVPQIDLAAHLGGFGLGLVLGLTLPLVRTDRGRPPGWLRVGGLVCTLALLATFAGNVICGLQYLRGRDLGAPVVRNAGEIELELPRKLEPRPLPGGLPGAIFERPFAALTRVVAASAPLTAPRLLAVLDLEWIGSARPEGDGEAAAGRARPPAPQSVHDPRGRLWLLRVRTRIEHEVPIRIEGYRTVLGGRVVQLVFVLLASDAERYRHVIEHALETAELQPGLPPVRLWRPVVYGPWPRPSTANARPRAPSAPAQPVFVPSGPFETEDR